MRPYWHVVPLQETTGRTLEPVPPASRPWSRRYWMHSSMSSYLTPWISSVRRVVMVTSPEPKRSLASATTFCSAAVSLPLRVITRTLKTSS